MSKNPIRLVSHFEIGHVRDSHRTPSQSVYGAAFGHLPPSRGPQVSERETRREFQHREHFDLEDGVSCVKVPCSSYKSFYTPIHEDRGALIYPMVASNKKSSIRMGNDRENWTTSNQQYMQRPEGLRDATIIPQRREHRPLVNNVFPIDDCSCMYNTKSESRASFTRPLEETTRCGDSRRWVNSGKKNWATIRFSTLSSSQ